MIASPASPASPAASVEAVEMEMDNVALATGGGSNNQDRRSSVAEILQVRTTRRRWAAAVGVLVAIAAIVGLSLYLVQRSDSKNSSIAVPKTFSAQFAAKSKQVDTLQYVGTVYKTEAADGTWTWEAQVETDPSLNPDATTKQRYTLLNKRLYLQTIDLATGAVQGSTCLDSAQALPLQDLPTLFTQSPLVPNEEFNQDVIGDCAGPAQTKYVLQWGTPTPRSQNAFVYCALNDGRHQLVGNAFIATLFDLNTADNQAGLGLTVPVDASNAAMTCPEVAPESALSPAATERRLGATQHMSEGRNLAAAAAWYAAAAAAYARRLSTTYKCVFMHGSGYATDTTVATSFSTYWGSVHNEVGSLCNSVSFIRRNMKGVRWTNSQLQQYFCDQIVTSGSTASYVMLFTHGTGTLVAAGAFANGLCTFATTSKWYAAGSPVDGTAVANAANASPSVCYTDASSLSSFFTAEGVCASTSASQAMQAATTSFMSSNSIRSTFNSKVNGWMCGNNAYGLYSYGKTDMLAHVDDYITFNSNNYDGFVDRSSCQDSSSSYGTSYGYSRYRAALNHLDLTCRAGDKFIDLDGNESPCSWYRERTSP